MLAGNGAHDPWWSRAPNSYRSYQYDATGLIVIQGQRVVTDKLANAVIGVGLLAVVWCFLWIAQYVTGAPWELIVGIFTFNWVVGARLSLDTIHERLERLERSERTNGPDCGPDEEYR